MIRTASHVRDKVSCMSLVSLGKVLSEKLQPYGMHEAFAGVFIGQIFIYSELSRSFQSSVKMVIDCKKYIEAIL